MKHLSHLFVAASIFLAFYANAFAQTTEPLVSPREQLNQLVNELSSRPNDYELRIKIIKLARDIHPLPAIPVEARRAGERGYFNDKHALTAAEEQGAVEEYTLATTLAPWSAQDYYNLGHVQRKAGLLAAADKSFGIFLLSRPNAEDAKAVEEQLISIEEEEEVLTKRAAEGKDPPETLLDALNGASYDCGGSQDYKSRINIRNRDLDEYTVDLRPPPPPAPPGQFRDAGPFTAAEASNDRRGLSFYMHGHTNRVFTVSPNQIERRALQPCVRIRGYK